MAPENLIQGSSFCFLMTLPVIILYQILTRRISIAGLLYERAPDGRLVYSPARVQLLLATVTGVAIYLTRFHPGTREFPAMDPVTVSGMGGSQTFYLLSKAIAAYRAVKS
jgi:hypothetical protein